MIAAVSLANQVGLVLFDLDRDGLRYIVLSIQAEIVSSKGIVETQERLELLVVIVTVKIYQVSLGLEVVRGLRYGREGFFLGC